MVRYILPLPIRTRVTDHITEHPPAIAMFAVFSRSVLFVSYLYARANVRDNRRYKREAFRHSEFAPRVLHDKGIKVLMKV